MSFVRKTIKASAIDLSSADILASLSDLMWPECGAATWRRQTPKNTHTWLDSLNPEVLLRDWIIRPLENIAHTVIHQCDMSGLQAGSELGWLEKVVVSLSPSFSGPPGVRFLRLRMEVVITNACRKFYIDAITACLVCTFRGARKQCGVSTEGTDPIQVFTVQTGSSILLLGTLWPQQQPYGILHRPSPTEGSGKTRLVPVLDPVDDLGEDI